MSENQTAQVDKVYESMKDLDAMELVAKKAASIKELTKISKQIGEFDVAKNSERTKMGKTLEKVQDQLHLIAIVDKLLKEKDF